jgi:hypothetical protein
MAKDTAQYAGTFWSNILNDPLHRHLVDAKEIIEDQRVTDLQTFVGCSGRQTTPLYRNVLIQPLVLRNAERHDELTWHIADNLVYAPLITDALGAPQIIWVNKIDYVVKDGSITFREDPFTTIQDHVDVVDSEGQAIDKEITLWLHGADYDEGYLSDMWGAAVGFVAPSSEEYRTLLNVVYEALIGGTSRKHVEQVVAAFSGAKLAHEDGTVVESGRDSRGFFLATDKHIYRSVPNGLPIVDIGSQVKAGDPLFNTCTFYRATDNISAEQLNALTIPRSLLDASIGNDLTFQNREVPLTISDGRVQFEVGGQPEAVTRFWDLFNSRKTPDGRSLADLLAGQTTINPFKFIQQNVLRNNCLLCVLRSPKMPPRLSGIDQDRLLRLIIPPHETLLVANQ